MNHRGDDRNITDGGTVGVPVRVVCGLFFTLQHSFKFPSIIFVASTRMSSASCDVRRATCDQQTNKQANKQTNKTNRSARWEIH
jgi:hypothetical protein